MTRVCTKCGYAVEDVGENPPCMCEKELTSIQKKRGSYPNTDKRRAYMREYMKKRRKAGKCK